MGAAPRTYLRQRVSRPGRGIFSRSVGNNREAGANPARSRHCDRLAVSDPLADAVGKDGNVVGARRIAAVKQ